MKIEEEILLNKYGQGLVENKTLLDRFKLFDLNEKRTFLTDMTFLIMQSKPNNNDIENIILKSELKPTYTPCILLKMGIAPNNLQKIIALPENELAKAFKLFLSVFKISYQRRFEEEKNHPEKWWYWDLSDDHNVESIKKNFYNGNYL